MINIDLVIGIYFTLVIGIALFLGTRTLLPSSLKGCILIVAISMLWPILLIAYILMIVYAFVSTLFVKP